MKKKNWSELIAIALLMIVSAAPALPQSIGKESKESQQELPGTYERGSIPQSGLHQITLGLVLPEASSKPAEPLQVSSSYSRFVNPVDGLTADDLVRYAMAHNGELQAARQMIAEARGQLHQAGLKPNPTVESSYQKGVTSRDSNFNIMAELPLELGGRRAARVGVRERELELRKSEVADFERRLAAEVRTKYADAIASARNLKFTEDLLALTRDSHRLVEARVERGKSAPLEQNLVFVELSHVDAIRIKFESRTETAMFELKKIIGMPSAEPLQLRGEFDSTRLWASQAEAVTHALAARPDLLAARTAEEVALARIEQARVEGKVDASLFASYMRQNMGYPVRGFDLSGQLAPVHGIFHYVGFGVKLSLPVRNKNQGLIEAAQASLEAARNRREFAEIVVRNEVAAAYARFERARQALEVYRDNVRNQALSNLDVIRQTYTLGQKSLLDYIAEQRRYIEIETGYTDVLKEYLDSLVEIELAAAAPVPSV